MKKYLRITAAFIKLNYKYSSTIILLNSDADALFCNGHQAIVVVLGNHQCNYNWVELLTEPQISILRTLAFYQYEFIYFMPFVERFANLWLTRLQKPTTIILIESPTTGLKAPANIYFEMFRIFHRIWNGLFTCVTIPKDIKTALLHVRLVYAPAYQADDRNAPVAKLHA